MTPVSPIIRYKPRPETKRIILHDSHTRPDVCEVEDVERWTALAHTGGLRMGYLGVGYHDIIERGGHLVVCRDHRLIGSHTPGHNLDSIAICLVGGREEVGGDGVDNFDPAQRMALLRRCHEYRTIYGPLEVVGHSEVQRYRNKTLPPCPPIDMDEFRIDLDYYEKGYALV